MRSKTISIRDVRCTTTRHSAASSGSVEIITILLDKVMCVDLTNWYESTSLHVSAECGNLEVTKTLVERGSPLDKAYKEG